MGTGDHNAEGWEGGGVTLRWTSIPSRGSSNIPSRDRFMLQMMMGLPARMQTLPFFTYSNAHF